MLNSGAGSKLLWDGIESWALDSFVPLRNEWREGNVSVLEVEHDLLSYAEYFVETQYESPPEIGINEKPENDSAKLALLVATVMIIGSLLLAAAIGPLALLGVPLALFWILVSRTERVSSEEVLERKERIFEEQLKTWEKRRELFQSNLAHHLSERFWWWNANQDGIPEQDWDDYANWIRKQTGNFASLTNEISSRAFKSKSPDPIAGSPIDPSNTLEKGRWNLPAGSVLLRRDIHEVYGGQRYGGISAPKESQYVFLFTDPRTGKKFGYDKFEGPQPDGSYHYSGEGQVGDQEFKRGNKTVLLSRELGKTILLFEAESPHAKFLGEFTLGNPEYTIVIAPDIHGTPRRVILFHLTQLN